MNTEHGSLYDGRDGLMWTLRDDGVHRSRVYQPPEETGLPVLTARWTVAAPLTMKLAHVAPDGTITQVEGAAARGELFYDLMGRLERELAERLASKPRSGEPPEPEGRP